ncbi:MAG TPA: ATPase, T2SS/T4P/T4SS family [Armatimonadota bacterium]|nr:ATPase, T2SS/T4P/T4SS family [Armatimonadota bacterium]
MPTKHLGDILVTRGYVTADQLKAALETQGGLPSMEALGDTLVSMGYLSQKDKHRCLAEQWGVDFVELESFPLDTEILKLVGQEICRRYKAIPLSRPNGKVVVAMKEPNDIYAIDALRLILGVDVEPVLAEEEDIIEAIGRYYQDDAASHAAFQSALKDIDLDNIEVAASSEEGDDVSVEQLRELVEEAPVVRLANLILSQAVKDGASDIHIEPTREGMRVRYRVDGILHEGMALPRKVQSSLTSRVKIMASMDIAEKRAPQDGRISLLIEGKQWDFRVSTLPSVFGEKVVLRVLDKSAISIGLHRLGILPKTLEQFENLIQRTYGIILVTGPTGSGKSTTLYSVLSKLNSPEKNILTIEDPVEYELPGITQVGVNPRAGLSFAAGLKCMLRQDPNIIMLGEIRDEETGTIAVEAALTGHLVLSTLHTNDAPGAVARLLDMGIEPFLISSAVCGVLAQRLVRVICPRCKQAYQPPMDAVRRLGMSTEANQGVKFYRGKGCESCKGTGYKGRTGIYEVMTVNDEIRELALERGSNHKIKDAAIRNGMITLKADATEKVLLGVTTLEETLRVIYSG